MRAGELRHKITIQQLTETPRDSVGAPARTWTTFAACNAEVNPLRGVEAFQAQQRYPTVDHQMRLRHLAGVTAKMRVSFDSRIFDIKGVLRGKGERRIETILMTQEQA